MKANKTVRQLKDNKKGYVKVVGALVALLLMIIVGVLVYWETQSAVESFGSVTETFTTDTAGNTFTTWDGATSGSNYTGEQIELDNSPYSITSISAWNTTGTPQTLTVTTHYTNTRKIIDVTGDVLTNFTQLNVTYVSNMANTEDSTSDMATTIFDLLPIIALAVVASIIIGVVIGFGGSTRRL